MIAEEGFWSVSVSLNYWNWEATLIGSRCDHFAE